MGRKQWTENDRHILFNEVDGLCPLCCIPLIYETAKTLQRRINLAHIYPYSPTSDEEILLSKVERLSKDTEDIKNMIWLCPNCHEKFDKPRTVEGYNELLNIKKELLAKAEIKNEFYSYKIEDEIKQVLKTLSGDNSENQGITFEYNPKTIDNKTNNTIKPLTKRKIKNHVSEHFNIIKYELQKIDTIHASKADKIASQIKTFYLEASSKNNDQEYVYKYLAEWLHKKTNISEDASSIVISFFIQNCEVFSAVSE